MHARVPSWRIQITAAACQKGARGGTTCAVPRAFVCRTCTRTPGVMHAEYRACTPSRHACRAPGRRSRDPYGHAAGHWRVPTGNVLSRNSFLSSNSLLKQRSGQRIKDVGGADPRGGRLRHPVRHSGFFGDGPCETRGRQGTPAAQWQEEAALPRLAGERCHGRWRLASGTAWLQVEVSPWDVAPQSHAAEARCRENGNRSN